MNDQRSNEESLSGTDINSQTQTTGQSDGSSQQPGGLRQESNSNDLSQAGGGSLAGS